MPSDLNHELSGRLKTLAAAAMPPYDWTEFRQRAERIPASPPHAALAAGLITFIAGLALWARVQPVKEPPPIKSPPDIQAVAQSHASQQWLESMSREPAVVRVGARLAVADLEDRIASMDDALSAARLDAVNPAPIAALQEERARLVSSLAQVRYAQMLAAGTP